MRGMNDPDPPMDHRNQIAAGLSKLGMFLRTRDWRRAEQCGLTATQTRVLACLVQRGPMRISHLADEIGVRQPTASDSARALLRKNLIERRVDPEDARASLIHLTDPGRATARALDQSPDVLLDAIESLDDVERAIMLRALTTLVRRLQTENKIPVQRMCVGCKFFRPNVHAGAKPHHCDFVDAAFGDADLRLDCGEHEPAPATRAEANFQRFRAREF